MVATMAVQTVSSTPTALAGTVSTWGGFQQSAASYDVSSWLTVPTVTSCGATEISAAASWVGLDYTTSVEQVGVTYGCRQGSAYYTAWYEAWPANAVGIGMAIHPGDALALNVQWEYSHYYGMSIYNKTTGDDFTTTQWDGNAHNASAECTTEYLQMRIPRIKKVDWHGCVANGSTTIPSHGHSTNLVVNGVTHSRNHLESASDFYETLIAG
jgi:hypothetical protein